MKSLAEWIIRILEGVICWYPDKLIITANLYLGNCSKVHFCNILYIFAVNANMMVYTIKIQDKSRKAKSIINMLKALQNDYDFIEISEDYENQNDAEIMKELELRYNSFLKDRNGKEWNVLMNELTK